MPEPAQGEVWWAALPPPSGRRPVLVLTRSDAISVLTNVTVAPLTRTRRDIPAEVNLEPADGVPKACTVSLENILTIRKRLLERRITALGQHRMRLVFDAIRHVFAMG